MKILIITTEFPPQPGGIGNHAYNLAKQLKDHQQNAVLICESRGDADYEKEIAFDQTLPFEVARSKRASTTLKRWKYRYQQAKKYADKEAEIVIASGLWPLLIVGFLKFINQIKVETWYIAHAVDVHSSNPLLKKITDFLLMRYDGIIAVSNYTKEIIRPEIQPKVEVIFNGIDCKRLEMPIHENGKLVGYPRLITVGSVTDRKGQNNVIKALPAIQKLYPDVHYHMVGFNTKQQEFAQLAEELGVAERTYFHGALDDNQMINVLRQGDIFMMLSNHTSDGDFEGFGIAVLEAAYLGIPAIGSRNSGISDAIDHKFSGLLVNPLDTQEITIAVKDILDHLPAFQENAKTHAKQFSWESIVKKYLETISSN